MFPDTIELWHSRARPNPTERDFDTQLGCHFEEICEMLDALTFTMDGQHYEVPTLRAAVQNIANMLKSGEVQATITDRKEFADSIGDQVVTAVGSAYCAHMKATEIVRRVNASNWSKFDFDGKPIRNANGKIAKGPNYTPPDLEGTY